MRPEEWKEAVAKLETVSDEAIQSEIRKLGIEVKDDKYIFGFWAIEAPTIFSRVPISQLRQYCGINLPDEAFDQLKAYSYFIIRAYMAFLYLRSIELESHVSKVSNSSPLAPFKEILGKSKNQTPGQHIRNALAHGGIAIDREKGKLMFYDRNPRTRVLWTSLVDFDTFDRLCGQIKRFYLKCYEVQNNIVR